jgi:cytochrome c-type biogenesis protein CcmH/NrfG
VGNDIDLDLDIIGVIEGTNKSSSVTLSCDYLRHYQRLFGRFRKEQINIVEIGVQGGPSLKVWKSYFTRAHIVGVDISPRCARFADDRVSIEIGSQDDPGFLAQVVAKYPPTIIVDDGSHRADHIIYTFERLFPSLVPGGIYVVEDLVVHCGPGAKKMQGLGGGSPPDYFLNLARSCLAGSVQGAAAWGTARYMLNHVDDIEFVHGAVMVHKKAAKRDISRTLDIADEYLRGRTPVAAEYERLGQFIMRHDGPCDRADAALQRASELGDESPDLLRNYAELRLRQNRFPEAAELAERRATLVGDAQTWNFAGNAHTCNGDHAAAARAYGRAACLQPGNPAYCRQLSEALERIGSLKEALAAARQGLEVAAGTGHEEGLRKRVDQLRVKVGE